VTTLAEEYGDETIRDPSSLRGAQRRSNPEVVSLFYHFCGKKISISGSQIQTV
jgi:hypothetical protein